MNELELIARLIPGAATNASVVIGPGDDCAVVQSPSAAEYLLLKTDAVVEGVHFTRAADPMLVGHKALGRCLSDIAAMAGRPLHALVTLALPAGFEIKYVEGIYAGLNKLARHHGVALVGGETVLNPERIILSVSVVGSVEKAKCVLRSGAKAGDAIFVTGTLGGSLSSKHLDFEPRLGEARWLVDHFPVHAMIDISDGLASDMRHLLEASRVGAELLASAIPISRAARLAAKAEPSRKTPLIAALTDGEDFELVFTVPSGTAVRLLDAWQREFPRLRLSCIGKVTASPGLLLRSREGVRPLCEHGYVHFE